MIGRACSVETVFEVVLETHTPSPLTNSDGEMFGREKCAMSRRLTAIVEREGDGYVALCPEIDVASQGNTVTEARDNLAEALTLFFETASAEEVDGRPHDEAVPGAAAVTGRIDIAGSAADACFNTCGCYDQSD